MRRYLKDLPVSAKLLFTSAAFVVILLVLAVSAYTGLSRQRTIGAELYRLHHESTELNGRTVRVLAQSHGAIVQVLANTSLPAEERAKIIQSQLNRVKGAIARIRQFSESTPLKPQEREANDIVVFELDQYVRVLAPAASAGTFRKLDPSLLASASRRFVTAVHQLETQQDVGDRLSGETFERSEKNFRSVVRILLALIVVFICLAVPLSLFLIRRSIVLPIRSMERAARRVSEGDLSFPLEPGARDEIGRTGTMLKQSFAALESVLQRIKELSARILMVVGEVERTAAKVAAGADTEAAATSSISSAVEEMTTTVTGISDNTGQLASSAEAASASIEQMSTSIGSINGSIQELNGLVASTSAAVEQLSTAIVQIAGTSQELEAASEETLSAVGQIADTVHEVKAHAKESADLAARVTSESESLGRDAMLRTIEGMNHIAASVNATAEGIQALGKRTQQIAGVLQVMESVNEETNLLALNASILAAQAGEHGKGFEVVARKMKDLAEKTEEKTREIAALISAVGKEMNHTEGTMRQGLPAVEEGIRLARAGEEALNRIVSSSTSAAEKALSIQKNTEEQARATARVYKAATRVKKMTDQIASSTAEQSQQVSGIARSAESMRLLSEQVSRATGEQAQSGSHISRVTHLVFEQSRQIAKSLEEHRNGAVTILRSLEAVKNIPEQNKALSDRISKTLWNLQKDVELLGAEMEKFTFQEHAGSLRFGVVPLKDPSEMYRKFKPLSLYLEQELGRKVDLKVAIDMESAVKDLGENVTQICAMGPANYVKAHKTYGIAAIAKALRSGQAYHYTAIVARADSPIRTLSDLRGRSIAFGSLGSATGHIMPLAMLRDVNLGRLDLSHYDFLGSHDKAVAALLAGTYDAAAVIRDIAEQKKYKGVRIVASSIEIPEFNICCHPSVDAATRDRIRDAFLALHRSEPEQAQVLQALGKDCTGFQPASDQEYEQISQKFLSVEQEVSEDTTSTVHA